MSLVVSNSSVWKQIDFWNSSKRNKRLHGIGLNSVRDIVEEYGGTFDIRQIKDRVVAKVELFEADTPDNLPDNDKISTKNDKRRRK